MEIEDRNYYIEPTKRTRSDLLARIELIKSDKYDDLILSSVDRLYQDFIEYIASQGSSQFTNENEDIKLAKDILQVTTNVRFRTIAKGFKLVDKFDFEE